MSSAVQQLEPSLAQAVRQVRLRSGLPVAFAGKVDRGYIRISDLAGNRTPSLFQLALAPDTGLGGRVLTLGRPVSVSDYANASAITHEYDAAVAHEGLRAIVAVPIGVRGEVVAVIYAGARCAMHVGDRAVESLVAIGRGIARDLEAEADAHRRISELLISGEDAVRSRRRSELREVLDALLEHVAGVRDPSSRANLLHTCDQLRAAVEGEPASGRGPMLSPRQRAALELVAMGCSDAEIAQRLVLDLTTVRGAVRAVRRAFSVHSRQAAVCAARASGVLQ